MEKFVNGILLIGRYLLINIIYAFAPELFLILIHVLKMYFYVQLFSLKNLFYWLKWRQGFY